MCGQEWWRRGAGWCVSGLIFTPTNFSGAGGLGSHVETLSEIQVQFLPASVVLTVGRQLLPENTSCYGKNITSVPESFIFGLTS